MIPQITLANQTLNITTASTTTNVLNGVSGSPNPATLSIVTSPAHGAASVDTATGAITYMPTTSYNGTDSLAFQVCSSIDTGLCSQATLTFHVTLPPATPNTGYGRPTSNIPQIIGSIAALVVLTGTGILLFRSKRIKKN